MTDISNRVIMSSVSNPYGVAPSSGAMHACLITLGIFALNQSQITSTEYSYSVTNTQFCQKQRVTQLYRPQQNTNFKTDQRFRIKALSKPSSCSWDSSPCMPVFICVNMSNENITVA